MGIIKSDKSMCTSFSGMLAHAQAVELYPKISISGSGK